MSSHRHASRIANLLMVVGAVTLLGASTVHLGIAIPFGFATPRDPFGGAAIPEAVLGVILGVAAVTMLASVRRAWTIGIATTTFAILVVLYGLSTTVRGGRIGHLVSHAMLLLILVIAGVALLRSPRALSKCRVVLCGAIARYNDIAPESGPSNYSELIVQRGRMEGFIVLDYYHRATEAIPLLYGWMTEGKLRYRTDIVHGLENAPAALARLFTGENQGKQLVKVADPSA